MNCATFKAIDHFGNIPRKRKASRRINANFKAHHAHVERESAGIMPKNLANRQTLAGVRQFHEHNRTTAVIDVFPHGSFSNSKNYQRRRTFRSQREPRSISRDDCNFEESIRLDDYSVGQFWSIFNRSFLGQIKTDRYFSIEETD